MKLGWLLGALAIAALLAGCGGGGSAEEEASRTVAAESTQSETLPTPECPRRSKRIAVTLDGHAGPENVGILMAERRGYFRDAGLHVWAGTPADPESPVPYVANGSDNLGVAQQPQIIIGRDEGAPLVGLWSLVSQPTEAMIWLRSSGIKGLADLKGKTIAFPGVPFQRSFLEKILARAGLSLNDVKLKRVGYDLVSTLSSGKADAAFGGAWNLEGAALQARGAHPVITKVQDLGIPGYDEAVLFAPFECIYKRPELYRDFLTAVERGTRAAVKDPTGAAQVIEEDIESDPAVGRRALKAQLKATLPLLSQDGVLSPSRLILVKWMAKEGMIGKEWPVGSLFTNAYLP